MRSVAVFLGAVAIGVVSYAVWHGDVVPTAITIGIACFLLVVVLDHMRES